MICDDAERALSEAGFLGLFGKGAARRRLAEAEQRYNHCEAEATALQRAHDAATSKVARLQYAFDKEQARRRADRASEIQHARADVALAAECETVATDPPTARRGIDAVEDVARVRLQVQATVPLSDADRSANEDASTLAPR